MKKFVAQQNIERYRALLAAEKDEHKQQVLRQLIAEEERKLQDLSVKD